MYPARFQHAVDSYVFFRDHGEFLDSFPKMNSQTIIRLSVSNILRIKAAEVRPEGDSLVIVAGRNDQGKTSLLNSIAIALSGKDLPEQPIRQGASTAQVILETEDFIVSRSFSQTGGSKLEVRDRDGAKLTSPQAKLDALFSRVTFDPLTFVRLDADKQAETVRKLAGLDFTELEQKRAAIYTKRTEVGRDVSKQEGILANLKRDPDAPAEEVALTTLLEEYEAAQKTNDENDRQRDLLSDLLDRESEARLAIQEAEAALAKAKETLTIVEKEKARMKGICDSLKDSDLPAIKAKIDSLEATNHRVRANKAWSEAHHALTAFQAQQRELTAQIEALDKERDDATAKAKYPIDGLSFSESGVAFEGVPFKQISTSKQIRVSLAIACALNPNLRVMLIRDGSLLDADSLELVSKFAAEHKAQVFMECVGDRSDATVIIEDGTVIAEPKKAAKAKK